MYVVLNKLFKTGLLNCQNFQYNGYKYKRSSLLNFSEHACLYGKLNQDDCVKLFSLVSSVLSQPLKVLTVCSLQV